MALLNRCENKLLAEKLSNSYLKLKCIGLLNFIDRGKILNASLNALSYWLNFTFRKCQPNNNVAVTSVNLALFATQQQGGT